MVGSRLKLNQAFWLTEMEQKLTEMEQNTELGSDRQGAGQCLPLLLTSLESPAACGPPRYFLPQYSGNGGCDGISKSKQANGGSPKLFSCPRPRAALSPSTTAAPSSSSTAGRRSSPGPASEGNARGRPAAPARPQRLLPFPQGEDGRSTTVGDKAQRSQRPARQSPAGTRC